jgi:hypothetical protein
VKEEARDPVEPRWLAQLDDSDIVFIKRFLLASGSLKKVANAFGVSYPTIRLRLDRLIAKIEIFDQHRNESDFEQQIRARYVEGRMDFETFKSLLKAYRAETKEQRT